MLESPQPDRALFDGGSCTANSSSDSQHDFVGRSSSIATGELVMSATECSWALRCDTTGICKMPRLNASDVEDPVGIPKALSPIRCLSQGSVNKKGPDCAEHSEIRIIERHS